MHKSRASAATHTTSTEWILTRRPSPFTVAKPRPFRPDTLLLMDARLDLVLAVEAIEPATPAAEAARWAADFVTSGKTMAALPQGVRVKRPRSVRVEDAALAEALAAILGADVAVRVGPAPEADAAMDSLAEFEGDSAGRQSPPEDALLHSDPGAFFEAAAAFYRRTPWKIASDSQVLRLDAPELGLAGACVTILGAAGETYGFALLQSLDDYLAFLRRADAPSSQARYGVGVPVFMVNFDHVSDVPGGRKLGKQAKGRGFEIAGPRAFPWIQNLSADGVWLPVEAEDYERAAGSLKALTTFLHDHASLFEGEATDPVSETIRAPHEVTVTAPYPGVPWLWGVEQALDGVRRVDAEAARDAYLDSRRGAGASEAEIEADGACVSELIGFGVLDAGSGLAAFTPDLVAEYLTEYYPRRGAVAGVEIESIPGRLAAFFQWLGAAGRMPAASAKAIRQRIDREAKSFARIARDPKRFGPAKTIVTAMLREGVDPTDKAAVGTFIEDFNRRLARDPDLLPTPDLPGLRPASRKWVWDGQSPPPDPVGGCPCGSGRRYRKCCMPR